MAISTAPQDGPSHALEALVQAYVRMREHEQHALAHKLASRHWHSVLKPCTTRCEPLNVLRPSGFVAVESERPAHQRVDRDALPLGPKAKEARGTRRESIAHAHEQHARIVGPKGIAQVFAYLMKEAISDHQWPSVVISGHKWSSVGVSGNQCAFKGQSVAPR